MDKASTDRIEKRIELKAPVARVWRALTDHKEFGEWFRVSLESPFVPGETTRGKITHPGCEHMLMEVVVQKMERERLFSFHWHPCGISANPSCFNDLRAASSQSRSSRGSSLDNRYIGVGFCIKLEACIGRLAFKYL